MKIRGLYVLFIFLSAKGNAQYTIVPTGTTDNLLGISIFNNNIVISGRDNYLAKSNDECNSLTLLSVPEPVGFQNYLTRVDDNTSYMLSTNNGSFKYKIYKSIDGCATWTKILDSNSFYLDQLRFFNPNDGIGVTSVIYQSLQTSNGGNSWMSSPPPIPIYSPTSLEVFGDSLVCLGGLTSSANSVFIISKNRGTTWTFGGAFPPNLSFPRKSFFLSNDTILGVSSKGYTNAYFATTFDKGANWQFQVTPLFDGYGVNFKNRAEGYILGVSSNSTGVILKTTDLGQTWLSFNPPINSAFIDMKFLNDSIALVSGTNGLLMKWDTKATLFTGINQNNFDEIGLKLYPNPVKEKLKIEFSVKETKETKLSITNSLGQLIYTYEVNYQSEEIDISSFKSGLYFLRVQNNSNQKVFKIIKE